MHLIATIDDPAVIQKILARLGLPGAREDPRPPLPRTAAGTEGSDLTIQHPAAAEDPGPPGTPAEHVGM